MGSTKVWVRAHFTNDAYASFDNKIHILHLVELFVGGRVSNSQFFQLTERVRILAYVFTTVLGLILICKEECLPVLSGNSTNSLAANVKFDNIYTPYSGDVDSTNATQRVIAGLAPVSSYGLNEIPLAELNVVAASYTMGFMTDRRFVTSMAPVQCSGQNCLSIFLPGGMDTVRIDDDTGLYTLFSGQYPGDYSSIVIKNAPGFQMEYDAIEAVDSGFQFDRNSDCKMYLGSIQDGLFLCMVEKSPQLYLGRITFLSVPLELIIR